MADKYLLLVNNNNGYFPDKTEVSYEYELYSNKIKPTKTARAIRKLHLNSFMPFKKVWFSDWDNVADECSTIVLFDTGNASGVLNYLKNKYPKKRIIMWYWGPVEISVNPLVLDRSKCEIWSFDEGDCEKYGFHFNSQFYFKENLQRQDYTITIENNYDILFVGTEKNRLKLIEECDVLFKSLSIPTYFHVVKSKTHYKSIEGYEYKKEINYNQLLSYISKSKVILDLVASDQIGMTLRPVEALFWKKKLITNDINIFNRDIYNRNNIFVLGVDSENRLKEFVESSYDMKDYNRLVEYYSADKWASRFYNV